MLKLLYGAGWAYLAVCGLAIGTCVTTGPRSARAHAVAALPGHDGDAERWFLSFKQYCNAVEVEMRLKASPPPAGTEGQGYGAACLALAGRTDAARELLEALPTNERWRAAGIVFGVGHPVADMGDDRSAGPIMELVVEFWPNHYMALYHAGAARFTLGELDRAEPFLRDFLHHYEPRDGWTSNAEWMLGEIER